MLMGNSQRIIILVLVVCAFLGGLVKPDACVSLGHPREEPSKDQPVVGDVLSTGMVSPIIESGPLIEQEEIKQPSLMEQMPTSASIRDNHVLATSVNDTAIEGTASNASGVTDRKDVQLTAPFTISGINQVSINNFSHYP